MAKVTDEKIAEYRSKVIAGKWRWQFGSDPTAVTVTSVHVGVVTFQDGHRDPQYTRIFSASYDEFATYLAENDAQTHWTCGA